MLHQAARFNFIDVKKKIVNLTTTDKDFMKPNEKLREEIFEIADNQIRA